MTTVQDVINMCDARDSGLYPQGLPKNYSWYKGTSASMNGGHPCPAGWTAQTLYWVVYPQDFTNEKWEPANHFIRNAECWLHKKTGGWIRSQDPSMPQACGRFDGPQTGNQATSLPGQKQADGSWKFPCPPLNYCNHGWTGPRGSYPANSVDWACVYYEMKIDNPAADFLMMAGMDWWQSPSAPYPNNMGSGACSWIKLTTDWKPQYCTEMDKTKFAADPPPFITGEVIPPEPEPEPEPATSGVVIEINGQPMKETDVVTFKLAPSAQPTQEMRRGRSEE